MKQRWIFAIGLLVLFVGAMPSYTQWSTDPTINNAICAATNEQLHPTIVSDGAGGAIITWSDWRSGYGDIYAQRINASGVVQWTTDGVAICTATNYQFDPTIASDGAGGAIITWEDYRSGSSDIYAQCVRSDGTLGDNSAPLAYIGSDQTVIVNETVQLDGSGSSDPDGDPITYSWEITSKPAGSNATLSNPSTVNPSFIADVAGEYTVSLTVNDGMVNSTPDEVIITAITAQQASQNLIDQVQALIDAGVLNGGQGNALISKLEAIIKQLDKGNTTAAINELQAFINEVNAFINSGTLTPGQGQSLIDAANAIIAALNNPQVAKAGFQADANEGFKAVDPTNGSLPTGFQLEQNTPNPFKSMTRISFALPEPGEVSLAIYSMQGQLVRRLIGGMMNAGYHSIVWNARDASDHQVTSGVYVYVIKAGNFIAQKKLLFVK
jgi:hypothetical protein